MNDRWPELSYEDRDWIARADQPMSRRARMAARGPYRAAVPGRISRAVPVVSDEALAAADDAGRELARFDAETGSVTAPFASVLLRTESSSSSEIEQITASAKQLALAEMGSARSGNARLVHANVSAMRAAIGVSESLDESAIIEMHRALLADSTPDDVGDWRDEQVWIGGRGASPHGADFVPPHHDRVPALMSDLVEFLRRTDLPVIVHAALAHAQFETIHPFTDGNGRTGRALVHGLLKSGGVTQNISVPVSAGLLTDVEGYFAALTAFRRGDVTPIVERFSDAAFAAIENGRRLIEDLKRIREQWDARVRARTGATARRMLDLLISQPIINASAVASQLSVSVVSATSAAARLEDDGVLSRANSGDRNRLWQASEVLDALNAFAARARRR